MATGEYGIDYEFHFPDGEVTRKVIRATQRPGEGQVVGPDVVIRAGSWRVVDVWEFPTHCVARLSGPIEQE